MVGSIWGVISISTNLFLVVKLLIISVKIIPGDFTVGLLTFVPAMGNLQGQFYC
jgi:hypothetical protein